MDLYPYFTKVIQEAFFSFFFYLRFRRKVDHGRILTLCPIIDILCSVGCRLKMTMSPSHMCLST